MVVLEPRLVLLHIIELVMLSILFGIGASWCWVLWSLLKGQPLLPEKPLVTRGKTPWGSGSVLLVFILYVAVILLSQSYVLLTAGASGEGPPAVAAGALDEAHEAADSQDAGLAATPAAGDRAGKSDQQPASPVPPGEAKKDAREFSLLESMSIQAVDETLLILLLPLVLRLTSGARLNDFGLSRDRWGRQVTIGVVAVLSLMPIIFGTQWFAYLLLGPVDKQFRHPLETMLRNEFTGVAAGVALLTAVVVAPLFEELMFRGIFQSWLVEFLDRFRRRFVSRRVEPLDPSGRMFSSNEIEPSTPEFGEEIKPADGIESHPGQKTGIDSGNREWASECGMVEDRVTDVAKLKVSTPELASPISAGLAIIVTSLIFASLHAGQWPAPIPILVLALGLGLVYYRTGSLLAVVCMHAVFNASSTLALLFSLMAGVPAEGDKKVPPPAVERKVGVEKVKLGAKNGDTQPD
jgi:membrane protease YdiL (CAAX protease family)